MKIKLFENFNQEDRIIKTTYQIVTPESAEYGDYAEQGWEDEEGESMIPDEYDIDNDVTTVDKSVEFLQKKGAIDPTSNIFNIGLSYTTPDPDRDYYTGKDTYYTCHLWGFDPYEELLIFDKIKNKKYTPKEEKEIKQKLKELEIKRQGDVYNI